MQFSHSWIAERDRRGLLLLKDEFINDVIEFRKKHSIPLNGIGKEKFDDYYYKLIDIDDDVTQADLNEPTQFERVTNDSRMLSEKYGIFGSIHDMGLEKYLITGDKDIFLNAVSGPSIRVNEIKRSDRRGNKSIKSIEILLNKYTRQEDIYRIWPMIRSFQKKMVGSEKIISTPSGVTEDHIEIYKQRKKGISSKEVGNEFGISYKEVDDIYRNTKEKIRRA